MSPWPRHRTGDAHAAHLGARDRIRQAWPALVGSATRRMCCTPAPTADSAERSLRDGPGASRGDCRGASQRRGKSGVAPKAVYALHEKLQKWGNPYQEAAPRPSPPRARSASSSATPPRISGRKRLGSGDQVVGGGRAQARAGRCRALERCAGQLARVSRHRHGTRDARCWPTWRRRAAASCSCSRPAIATPSNGSIANG